MEDLQEDILRSYAWRLRKVTVLKEMIAFSLTILINYGIPDNEGVPTEEVETILSLQIPHSANILHPAVMKRDHPFAINRIEIKTITIEEEDIAANKESCHLILRGLARRCLFLGNNIMDNNKVS